MTKSKKEFKKALMHPTRKKLVDFVLRDEQYSPTIGYEGETVHRKVGDVWEDEWYRYEKKEGYTLKTGKNHEVFQEVREHLRAKSECQNTDCKKEKYGPTDKQLISQTGFCTECLVEIEANIKYAGLWESYEKWRMFSKAIAIANDAKTQIQQGIKDLKPHYEVVQENGTIERWNLPKPVDVMRKEMEDEIVNIDKGLIELQEDIVIYEKQLRDADNAYIKKLLNEFAK